MASAGSPPLKALTYRVEGIPSGTSEEELKGYFHQDDRHYLKVKSLVPSVDSGETDDDGDYTATIFFRPHDLSQSAPRLIDDSLSLDKEFLGFTPLYVPPRERGTIAADIIAVTGLAGHAYGSWAHSSERMWLRDYLPKDAPNARILTYGYPSKLQGNASMSILSDHTNTFVHRLIDMREGAQCVSRPIIFIGHSLGCLIIKKALTDVGLMGLNSLRIPVRSIIFLAAPHRGLNITALQTLVKGTATEQLVLELRAESPTLIDINQRFAYIARDIDILTCYETQPTKTAILVDGLWKREGAPVMMVSPDSASQYYPRERRVPVDMNHSQIAKIMKGESGIYPNIKSAIRQGLVGMARIMSSIEASPVPTSYTQENLDDVITLTGKTNSSQRRLPFQSPSSSQDQAPLQRSLLYRPHPGEEAVHDTYSTGVQVEAGPSTQLPIEVIDIEEWSNSEEELRRDKSMDSSAPRLPSLLDSMTLTISTPGISDPSPSAPPVGTAPVSMQSPSKDQAADSLAETISLTACVCCNEDIPVADVFFRCYSCEKNEIFYCQQCYAKGLRCPENHTDSMRKSYFKNFKYIWQCLPHQELGDSEGDSELVRALKRGNLEELDQLAQDKIALEAYDKYGYTPLHVAAQLGLVEGLRILLKHKANAEALDAMNFTALMIAIAYDHPMIVEHLIVNGADVDAISSSSAPLLVAAEIGNVISMRLLLDAGANASLNLLVNKYSPLGEAACNGNIEGVKLLLQLHSNAIDIEEMDLDARTPLFHATEQGYTDCASVLLEAGSFADTKCGENCETSLCVAVRRGHSQLVTLLLQHHAAVNESNKDGNFPLILGIRSGRRDICQQLLDYGANVDQGNLLGTTALMEACSLENPHLVELLLKHNARIDLASNHDGNTAIFVAACFGRLENLKLLIEYGESVLLARIWEDWTALPFKDHVTQKCKMEVFRMLRAPMGSN